METLKGLTLLKDKTQALEALHRTADDLCGVHTPTKAALPKEPILSALQCLLKQVCSPVSAPTREQILKVCSGMQLSEEIAIGLTDGCLARRDEVRAAAGGIIASSISTTQLVDFDWRACNTVASDKAISITRPYVTVGLTLRNSGHNSSSTKEQFIFEADEKDLDYLINQLERAEAAITELRI